MAHKSFNETLNQGKDIRRPKGYIVSVWRVSVGCIEVDWMVSGMCLERIYLMYAGDYDGVFWVHRGGQ